MMKRNIRTACVLALGFAGGLLVNCDFSETKPTTLEVENIGKIFLKARKGQKIAWIDENNHPQTIVWTHHVSPCEESGDTRSDCTIKVTKGYYAYTCTGCTDPGLAVGSDTGMLTDKTRVAIPGPKADPPNPSIYCDDPTKPVTAEPIKGNPGESFQWFGLGEQVTTWTITLPAGTCTQGTAFDQTNSVCTIGPQAVAQPLYRIHAPGCTMPDGTGSLTIPRT